MNISGECIEDHELKGVKTSCIHCPVTCGRDVEVEGVGVVKGPEYETLALMGSNLEIGDVKKVSEWNYHADDLGMDTISLGATLSLRDGAGRARHARCPAPLRRRRPA